MFSQLFAGFNQVWLEVTLLAAIFTVLIFKPEKIQRPGYFWKGCVLFVLAIFVPAVLALFAGGINAEELLSGESTGLWQKILALVPAALFALSVLLTLFSLLPESDGDAIWPFSGKKPPRRGSAGKS